MENTERDSAQNAAPQNDNWQNAGANSLDEKANTENNELLQADSYRDESPEEADERLNAARADDYSDNDEVHAMAGIDTPDEDDDDDDDDEDEDDEDEDDDDEDDNDEDDNDDDEEGDWGHVDPAEGNSPFPDSNDPSGPGSAV
jgi:hypothetical protein